MAWENYSVYAGTFQQWIIDDTTAMTQNTSNTRAITESGTNLQTVYGTTDGQYTIFDINGFKFIYTISGNSRSFNFTYTENSGSWSSNLGYNTNYPWDFAGVGFAINESEQKGQIVIAAHKPRNNSTETFILALNDLAQQKAYPAIKSLVRPVHNWHSVQSIDGKLGLFNLSTLNNINDGEETSTSDMSDFNLTADSNVHAMVRKQILPSN